MTKQEAIKVAEQKYPLPEKDYKDSAVYHNLDCYIQKQKRQAFVEGILFALDPNNI